MDLFEIVSSFIPDEQKDNIKSQIDGEVGQLVKERETQLKKELSTKFQINFHEEDVEKAYSNKVFVKKDVLEAQKNEYEAKLATLTELQTKATEYETKIADYETKFKGFEEDKTINNLSLKLVKEGFNPDRLEIAKPLFKGIEGETDDVKIKHIKEKLPEFFVSNQQRQNPYGVGDNGGKGLTEAERYFEQIKKQNKQ